MEEEEVAVSGTEGDGAEREEFAQDAGGAKDASAGAGHSLQEAGVEMEDAAEGDLGLGEIEVEVDEDIAAVVAELAASESASAEAQGTESSELLDEPWTTCFDQEDADAEEDEVPAPAEETCTAGGGVAATELLEPAGLSELSEEEEEEEAAALLSIETRHVDAAWGPSLRTGTTPVLLIDLEDEDVQTASADDVDPGYPILQKEMPSVAVTPSATTAVGPAGIVAATAGDEQGRRGVKRGRDTAVPEPTEDSAELFEKLQLCDPTVSVDDYKSDGQWDREALEHDLQLSRWFSHESLEAALKLLREEMKTLVAAGVGPFPDYVEVIPGKVALGNRHAALAKEELLKRGVRRVINCSPQSVKTGSGYYGPDVAYLELWQDDMADYCVLQDFEAVWSFIGFAADDGITFLHCEQGVNRSGALAVALHMRYSAELRLSGSKPEPLPATDTLRVSWRFVIQKRGKVVVNAGFQRQLLLFARLGCRWFPSLGAVWQAPEERRMAKFRRLAEAIGRRVMRSSPTMSPSHQWRLVVFTRDGTMRGEKGMQDAYNLSSEAGIRRADRRIKGYAERVLAKRAFAD